MSVSTEAALDALNKQAMDGVLNHFRELYTQQLRDIVYTAAEPLIKQTAEEATKAIALNIVQYLDPASFAPKVLFNWYMKDQVPDSQKNYKVIPLDGERKVVCVEEQDKPWWVGYEPKNESNESIHSTAGPVGSKGPEDSGFGQSLFDNKSRDDW
jgi:hypothetical protein